MKENIVKRFKEVFGAEGDIRTFFAPGRVNLITMEVMYFHVR